MGKRLKFTIDDQCGNYWCWAAVAVGVSKYYSRSSPWTQCGVANALFEYKNLFKKYKVKDCCKNPDKCDHPENLENALTCTQNYAGKSHIKKSSDGKFPQELFEEVCREIDKRRPVAARIGLEGGGGHFVVIYGYETVTHDPQSPYFVAADPYYVIHSTMPVSENYGDYNKHDKGWGVIDGRWTDIFFTKGE
ncbi:MAG TPA: C39 family peptidase [Nitrospiria bacterium]|jgi:hypothetical protein|nr:C39 family peptidase [Nitrospiria bacterium]